MRQDVVLGWERINNEGWAWTQGEGLCPCWEIGPSEWDPVMNEEDPMRTGREDIFVNMF